MCLLSTVLDRDYSPGQPIILDSKRQKFPFDDKCLRLYSNNPMLTVLALFLFETFFSLSAAQANDFSFAIPTEIHSVDPAKITSADAAFFYPQIYRGLYRYHTPEGLKPEGATECKFESKHKVVCTLNPAVKWSDSSTVEADDYVRAWKNLIQKNSRSPAIELLQTVVNAGEIFAGKASQDSLGVKSIGPNKLEITLSKDDPDFIFKLASPLLVPVKKLPIPEPKRFSELIVNGPYKITAWVPGKRIRLEKNSAYPFGNPTRPAVEIYFINDDETVHTLYKEGRIKLVRRLQSHELPFYKGKPDLNEITVARFDYIGFGPELENQPELRKALSLSVDYKVLQKLMDSPGEWGCPSIPTNYMTSVPCVKQDLKAAKEAFAKVPKNIQNKRIKFAFSGAGGDHIKRAAEYFQDQWKKNLGYKVDLEQNENAIFLRQLRKAPYPVFRKGVALDRPTCLAALENFVANAPENFIRFNSATFEQIITKLVAAKADDEKRSLCAQGVQALIADNRLIPLGRMDFAFLVKPNFKGWHINEMNQLDLSNLYIVK